MTTTIETNNLIVADLGGSTVAGQVVWWTLRGSIDLDVVADLAEAVGAAPPLVPSPTARLKRAITDHARANEIVRPSRKGGFLLVSEGAGADGENEYAPDVRVFIGEDGEPSCEGLDDARCAAVRAAFAESASRLCATDMSNWLGGRAIRRVRAVALRETGGFYFVPAAHTETWATITSGLSAESAHRFYTLDAHTNETAMAAVVEAITAEAEALIGQISDRLADSERSMNARGIAGRTRDLDDLQEKLATYERCLGVSLARLSARAQAVKATLAAEMLEADDL
jgi:hypothetical protein